MLAYPLLEDIACFSLIQFPFYLNLILFGHSLIPQIFFSTEIIKNPFKSSLLIFNRFGSENLTTLVITDCCKPKRSNFLVGMKLSLFLSASPDFEHTNHFFVQFFASMRKMWDKLYLSIVKLLNLFFWFFLAHFLDFLQYLNLKTVRHFNVWRDIQEVRPWF